MTMVRIWHMYILLATVATVCLAIRSCNGAPLPLHKEGSVSREKRGIFGQLNLVTTTTTTATPRFKFGTTTKQRHSAPKKPTTTKRFTSTTATSELNEVSSTSSNSEDIALHEKQTTKDIEMILSTTVSTSSLSPVYVNSSPSALMLHQAESSEGTIVFPNYDDDRDVISASHSSLSKKENAPKEEEKHEESANNRALSPSSIWNLIVVLLQLAYTVTQQKIPP